MTEQCRKILDQLKADTAMEAYRLRIVPDSAPGLADSKFGGLAYWTPDKPYPADEQGLPMQLLAQINFSQFPAEAPLPQRGLATAQAASLEKAIPLPQRGLATAQGGDILAKAIPLPQRGLIQFFIARDDVFGADFHCPDRQKGFRVVYHPQVDSAVSPEQALALRQAAFPAGADLEELQQEEPYCTPVCREAAVEIRRQTAYMGPYDCRFEQAFRRAAGRALGLEMGENQSYQQLLRGKDRDELWKELDSAGHWMLGYPYFTQYDPRQPDGPYDTLLFQMDSDMAGTRQDYVLWGDCGVGNFFINRKDLENLDFSRVLYSWDCC